MTRLSRRNRRAGAIVSAAALALTSLLLPARSNDVPVQSADVPVLGPVTALIDGCFATSPTCAMCHSSSENATAMRDAKGRSVAPFDLWRSSMMANSARDPLWRAVVSAEVAENPKAKAAIEAKCLRCHSPMASTEKKHAGTSIALSEIYDRKARHNELALDGVSCTMCHQIEPDNLGKPESFSGGYDIASESRIYGPHKSPFSMPMQRFSEFVPTYGEHINASALCATCHTLTTHALDDDGKATAHNYLEQSPYLEWQNSAFNDEGDSPGSEAASCQNCHVPRYDVDGNVIRTRIARNPGGFDFPPVQEREPFGRHIFVGANTLVPAILRDYADELGSIAPKEAFDATIAAARNQLRTRTARLEVDAVGVRDGRLDVNVTVLNLAGHKFPSGHPTRRAWLRVVVRDKNDTLVFASGDYDENGRLRASNSAVLGSEVRGGPVQPHAQIIRNSDQVQIYEAVMEDQAGQVTFGLMRAVSNRKDNRLLPKGWVAEHANGPATAPVGLGGDTDFAGGRDTVLYSIPIPDATVGPWSTEVTLLYQTLGSRYADELRKWDTPEMRTFFRYYDSTARPPEVVAQLSKSIGLGK